MPKPQPTFTAEFKQEAVHLAHSSGKSKAQIARELGIFDSALSSWCREAAENVQEAFPGKGHQSLLEEENHRLRREVERAQQERDILKKSSYRISPNDELIQRALKQPVEPFLEQRGMRQTSVVAR